MVLPIEDGGTNQVYMVKCKVVCKQAFCNLLNVNAKRVVWLDSNWYFFGISNLSVGAWSQWMKCHSMFKSDVVVCPSLNCSHINIYEFELEYFLFSVFRSAWLLI